MHTKNKKWYSRKKQSSLSPGEATQRKNQDLRLHGQMDHLTQEEALRKKRKPSK